MRVGVVLTVHGWAPYLAEALDSVLAERPAEVVVVDDASPEPLRLHPDHARHCSLVRREQSAGPSGGRNTGVAALGDVELVAFCDADDAWEPASLALRVGALEHDPHADLVFGRPRIVGPDGRDTGERWALPAAGAVVGAAALYEHNPIVTSSVVLRRRAVAPFDEHLRNAEDWELWLRLAADGRRCLCVPDAVVRYRRHGGSLTSRVAELARAQRTIHERHAGLVDAGVAARALARDRAAEAAGLVRERRYGEARRLAPPGPRRAALAVPGVRGLLGRRDPYRRG